ncbi:hypothetical protein A2U01_0023700, partial [Trifolium medium]|nr:hypothetical protein [Trifolium medium]
LPESLKLFGLLLCKDGTNAIMMVLPKEIQGKLHAQVSTEISKGKVIGCFAHNIGIATALVAEIMGVVLAIECASNKHWN